MITLEYENRYSGKIVCGCDEVGRGPLAGPVVAASVVISLKDEQEMIHGVNDSKKLSAKKREELFKIIDKKHIYAIGSASIEEIEEINILNATKLAIVRAVENLLVKAEVVLVDGNMKFHDSKYISIIKGDQICYSIACASIVAKIYRDKLMKELASNYPYYGWEQNAGYGTKQHIEAIKEKGITPHHRKSFIHL